MKGLQLIMTLMCANKQITTLTSELCQEHERRVRGALIALDKEMDKNGNKVLPAAKQVFHGTCSSNHHCCSNEGFEKEVLQRYSELAEPLEEEEKEQGTPFYLEDGKEKELKRELDRALDSRNKAAYQLIQQFFARAHLKRVIQGEEALDPAERLLCDYTTVVQLKIASDPELLFRRVGEWLHTRIPGHCRACGKSTRKRGVKCEKCKMQCFCSVACQVNDESNRVFCHAHECGLLNY